MPELQFPDGYAGSERLPKTNTTLQNCFKIQGNRILGRPGIKALNTTGKVARGNFEWNSSLYQVVSTDLIRITDTESGAFTTIGTVAGPEAIETAVGFNDAVIVVPGGATYTIDTSGVLTDISGGANFVAFRDVCHIDNRFIYIPNDGSPAKYSDVGAADTIQAASFFDAETLPDNNKACFNLNNTLYIMGDKSIEPFRNSGDADNPFRRVAGGAIRNGFIGGLLEYDETFFFIGNKEGQNAGIFQIGSGKAPKISNERVDLLLSTYTDTELAEAIPGRLIWRGYDLATWSLRRDSFMYFEGKWFILDTVFDGVSRPWGAGYIAEFGGEYFTAYENRIGKFDKINTDYGERITRIIGMGAQEPSGDWFNVQSLELGISQGWNSGIGSVSIRMTRDNVQFGQEQYKNLGALGEYQKKLKWNPRGGLGSYEGFFGFEVYTAEDVDFACDSIKAEF